MPNGNEPPKPHLDKWPWSITDREFGALEQELKELRHDFRNLKAVVDMSGVSAVTKDEVNEFRQNVAILNQNLNSLKKSEVLYRQLSDEIMKLKIQIYTGATIFVFVAGIVMWFVAGPFQMIQVPG
jgi:hypothetical protein